MGKQIIAVDLGGTQIRTARYDEQLNILQRENTLTLADEGLEPTLERIKTYIHKVMPDNREDILGIGFSAPAHSIQKQGLSLHRPIYMVGIMCH